MRSAALLLLSACVTRDGPLAECGEVSPGSPDEPPDCRDLGTPCSECGGYLEADEGCSGAFHEAENDALQDSWCAMDQPLGEWCTAHLPCWHGAECPNFHEFLFVSGWLDTLPNVTPDYSWSWSSADSAGVTVTARCTTQVGAIFDSLEWRPDSYDGHTFQRAYFDPATGALVSVWHRGVDGCCGDRTTRDRWWGPRLDCVTEPTEFQLDFWWTRCEG